MAAQRVACSTSQSYQIVLYQGVVYSRNFQYTGPSGAGIDLAGKVLTIKFKDVFDNLFILSTDGAPSVLGSSFTITDEPNGKFRLQLSDEETATAGVGSGTWWIEIDESGNTDLLWPPDEVKVIEL